LNTISVNTATVEDLASLVYISYQLALNIVEYRTLRGGIVKLQELNNVDGFPKNKFERIKVYLSIK
jgi:DNA uptake protein ComE-like DNA-binding protein